MGRGSRATCPRPAEEPLKFELQLRAVGRDLRQTEDMHVNAQPMKAAEINLGKLFTNDFDFVIPEYQRPYAWGQEEALQLLADLEGALERDTEEPYFLGSVVLVKDAASSHSEVIDGQQRLTTLTILLSVLRDLVDDPAFRSAVHGFVEEPAVEWDDLPARPRLTLRPRDREFFRKHVQKDGATAALVDISDNQTSTDSQRGIRDNAKVLREKLVAWGESRLKELFKMLAKRTFVVTVSTPDLNSAYRIFSVMNARGLALAPSDIFKSQVIGTIPEQSRQHYADLWESLEENLGRDEFANLFLYIRMVVSRKRAVKSLLQEFPEQVLDPYLRANDGIAFIKDVLEPYAKADMRLVAQDFAGGAEWEKVNAWLKRLVELDNDDWRPLALWALRVHPDDPVFLSDYLEKLERLAASMLLRREYRTPRMQRYHVLLDQLAEGRGLDAEAFALSDTEKAATLEQLTGDIYLTRPVRRYVLLRLDSMLADNPGASYDHSVITVEHVLPQSPAVDSQWRQDFTDEEAERWVHRLGNLLLLNRRKNSQAQNYDFDKKKSMYFTSTKGVAMFALTTQVINTDSWTPAIVGERHERLVGLLADAWELR